MARGLGPGFAELAAVHLAQLISYLKARLLITFNVELLKSGVRRVLHSRR
jgi:hypothetical protein